MSDAYERGGFTFAVGNCYTCGMGFTFNPDLVPSYDPAMEPDPEIRAKTGGKPAGKQPMCSECIEIINKERLARGFDAIYVHPDAYGLSGTF